MSSLSATAYLVLGSVREGGRSGYEIKADIDRRVGFCWPVSVASIYPALSQLSEVKYIEGVDAPTGARRKTVHHITPAGEAALRDWLRAELSPLRLRDEGMLKLCFADPDDVIDIARSMRNHRIEQVDKLRKVIDDPASALDDYQEIVLRGGIELNEWYAGWLERFEAGSAATSPQSKGAGDVHSTHRVGD